jgi:hypothetical protein
MMKLYYMIWVDCLLKLKSLPSNRGIWQFNGYMVMSAIMMLNLMVAVTVIEDYLVKYPFYHNCFGNSLEEGVVSNVKYITLFLGPPLIINYLLIFKDKKYEILFKKYSYQQGKLFIGYALVTVVIPYFIILIFGFVYYKLLKY